eukprot:gene55835-19672_t
MYGLFLAACGTAGSALHGFDKPAMHGRGCGIIPVAIGVHVALLLQAVFIIVFSRMIALKPKKEKKA